MGRVVSWGDGFGAGWLVWIPAFSEMTGGSWLEMVYNGGDGDMAGIGRNGVPT